MKGLLVKEWYSSLIYGRNFVLMLLMFGVMGVVLKMGTHFVTTMIMVYLVVVSMGLYSVDEACKWDRYAISLPVKRGTVVGARYLFLVLYMLGVIAVAFLLGVVVALINGGTLEILEQLATCGVGALAFMLINAVIAPVVYKFGSEKARVAMIIVYMVPFVGLTLFATQLEAAIAFIFGPMLPLLVVGAAVFIAALYVISWRVSTAIYAKREY